MGTQIFNFAYKFPQNGKFLALKFAFLEKRKKKDFRQATI